MATFRLIEGDCIEAMSSMDEASVDAIVTDPPYGLEFMGKEWDSFRAGRSAAYSSMGEVAPMSLPGTGFTQLPSNHRPAKRCANCGKQSWSGSPCTCDEPRWVMDNSPLHAYQDWTAAWATQALRILKPGGHLLAFGGTRTYHRLTCALEDAGFEIRDCLAWLYGSGFPKSLDVSKAIDKAAGAEREVIGQRRNLNRTKQRSEVGAFHSSEGGMFREDRAFFDDTAPATDEAAKWNGWGTALKPAFEPIVLARKPLIGSVAKNVTTFGTGALNIDGTRIGFRNDADERESKEKNRHADFGTEAGGNAVYGDYSMVERKNYEAPGRWPANVILDEEAARMLDEQSGDTTRWFNKDRASDGRTGRELFGEHSGSGAAPVLDEGGASRYFKIVGADAQGSDRVQSPAAAATQEREASVPTRFRYIPKADREERNRGLGGERNIHPTLKPVELMQWLCRLVCPPGGVVLDPFTGSGSTGMAALREGFDFIGVEREHDYIEIARARIIGDGPLLNQEVTA